MSSFTSSSNASSGSSIRRRGIVVILAVLVALLGIAEMVLRARETSLSIDLRHIRSIPSIVKRMDDGPHPRVLFLGNSLTRYGVKLKIINDEMTEQAGDQPSFQEIYPDDSSLIDWHYIYERYVVGAGTHPDLLIVSYALFEMDDGQPTHPKRLGHYFSNLQAAPEMFRYDLKQFDERAIFLLSNVSSLFANRERIRDRVLAAAIPGYRQTAQSINFSIRAAAQHKAGDAPPVTHTRVGRFVSMVRRSGARVIIVAMPQPGIYEVADDLIRTVKENGGEFVDMRKVDGISKSDFFDGFHLGPSGAERYSEALGQELLDLNLVQRAAAGTRMQATSLRSVREFPKKHN